MLFRSEDWAVNRQKVMDDHVARGAAESDEDHWILFETVFDTTFTNMGEKVSAERELHTLRMQNNDIDTYIAKFKNLTSLAGYADNELGVLNMFKKGLPPALNIRIELHQPNPHHA